MDLRLQEYLRQMKIAAQESIEFVNGMSYAEFEEDTKTQRAVTMNLVILAEAAAKIEERYRDFALSHPEIACSHPSMRNSLGNNRADFYRL